MLIEVYYENYAANAQGPYWEEQKSLPYMVLVREKPKREHLKQILKSKGFRCVAWNDDYPGVLVNTNLRRFGLIHAACKHACINDRNYSFDEFINEILE